MRIAFKICNPQIFWKNFLSNCIFDATASGRMCILTVLGDMCREHHFHPVSWHMCSIQGVEPNFNLSIPINSKSTWEQHLPLMLTTCLVQRKKPLPAGSHSPIAVRTKCPLCHSPGPKTKAPPCWFTSPCSSLYHMPRHADFSTPNTSPDLMCRLSDTCTNTQ